MTDETRTRAPAPRARREGFSLVEVALALMVAATGMLAVFALFPASMRQTVSARTDMKGALFASTVLETIAGNVRQIDDIAVWNNPQKWWAVAVNELFEGDDKAKNTLKWANSYTASEFRSAARGSATGNSDFSPATVDVAINYQANTDPLYKDMIRYFGREEDEVKPGSPIPPQYLIRFEAIRRKTPGAGETVLPNRYLVSVVSSPKASPQIFIHEQIYAQEYYFVHRP